MWLWQLLLFMEIIMKNSKNVIVYVVATIIITVVICCLISLLIPNTAVSTQLPTSTAINTPRIISTNTLTHTSTPQPTNTQIPTNTPTPIIGKQWKTIATLSGSNDGVSDVFTLSEGITRITYAFTSTDTVMVGAIFIMEEDKVLDKDGGFSSVEVYQPERGSATIRKEPGTYYINVLSSDDYTVSIQQLL